MIALVEIAIVLCSMFLVAIPAIAADEDVQKVSEREVTTASEDDYVLEIYGNANEDDTIDMGDVVYVKLAIFGKKPKTELCDAKYDGRINVLDVIQTKLIILGKERELTYIASDDKTVTVKKPIKRIVALLSSSLEVVRTLNAEDRVVGVSEYIVENRKVFFPELSKLPNVGGTTPDCEVVLSLTPDIVLTYGDGFHSPGLEDKLPGITVVRLTYNRPMIMGENVEKLGYILDSEERAKEYADFVDGYMDIIEKRVEKLSEDEKPRVYMERHGSYRTSTKSGLGHQHCVMAGGINIAADLTPTSAGSVMVDPEWVLDQNPDIIISAQGGKKCGYDADDPAVIAVVRDEIMNRPGFANVAAVKKEKVYLNSVDIWYTPEFFISVAYYAKWFHPDLFEDLDPEAIQQEYLDRFQGLDYDLNERGIFVYPPIEIDGGLAGIPDRYKGEI